MVQKSLRFPPPPTITIKRSLKPRAYAFPCQTRKSVLYVFAIAGSNPRFCRLRGDRREVRLLQLRHSVTRAKIFLFESSVTH